MSKLQRYVSDELSHFVGRGRASEDEQYDLLVNKILRTGWLTHPPHKPDTPRGVRLNLAKPMSTDESIDYEVVCFCDIPVTDLALHISKYSKFGLSFRKEFLIPIGACPVFYVANESPIPSNALTHPVPIQYEERFQTVLKSGVADRALAFDAWVKVLFDILRGLDSLNPSYERRLFQYKGERDSRDAEVAAENEKNLKSLLGLNADQLAALKSGLANNKQAFEMVRRTTDFLCNYVFSYVKCFDAMRPVEDLKHYYMEREWRVANHVRFTLKDVQRVFMPAAYGKRFRQELPDYFGQLTFVD
jgi:hypothetical protein